MSRKIKPIHSGEILNEEFLKPLALRQYRIAKDISVPPLRINEIINGERAIFADTALWFSRYFGTSAQFWLNLQARYDLDQKSARLSRTLLKEVCVLQPAAV